ncbi:class I SAM-dependent methyltransferase [archaeon]|nr:class I SAM-dependent methyltransferase [archaeon]
MNKEYCYPAGESERGVVNADTSLEKNWNILEKNIMDKIVLPYLSDKKHRNLMIDIGAGEGRYTREYGKFFKKIISTEPDRKRSKKITNKGNLPIKVINKKIEDINLGKNKADAIFCIHVLQHVSDKTHEIMLNKATKALKKNGLLILGFTFKTKYFDEYNISWLAKGEKKFTPIPKEIFNLIAERSLKGILPVKKLDKGKLIKKLERKGFVLKEHETYFVDLEGKKLSKLRIFFLDFFSIINQHRILKKLNFDNFIDCILVLKKK